MATDDDGLPGQGGDEYEAHQGGILPEEEEIWNRLEKELAAEKVYWSTFFFL